MANSETVSGATSILANAIASASVISSQIRITEGVNKDIKQQSIDLELAQQQARVAQELAIALRIETADEVEIEEFYDDSRAGNAGLKVSTQDLSFGGSSAGRRITKRIFKFKGNNGEKVEVYQQKLNEILSPKLSSDND